MQAQQERHLVEEFWRLNHSHIYIDREEFASVRGPWKHLNRPMQREFNWATLEEALLTIPSTQITFMQEHIRLHSHMFQYTDMSRDNAVETILKGLRKDVEPYSKSFM